MKRLIHRHRLFSFHVNRSLVVISICAFLAVYFSYHLIHGERSLLRALQIEAQIKQSQVVHADLVAERVAIEARVKMMRPGSVEPDLMDERIRAVLGYTRSGEMILSTGG